MNTTVSAQFLFEMNTSAVDIPNEIFVYEKEDLSDGAIQDQSGTAQGDATLSIVEERKSADLSIVSYQDFQTQLTYSNPQQILFTFSDNTTLTADDLPQTLVDKGWSLNLPLSIGSGKLSLTGGHIISSDEKDVSNEDYYTYASAFYRLDASSPGGWSLGVFQQAFLGKMSDVIPLIQYESPSETSSWMVGFIHIPGFFNPPVLPYFGYGVKTGDRIAIELVYPKRLSVYVRITENLSALLAWKQDSRSYRLTEELPWKSSVLESTQVRQTFRLNYHLGGLLLLGVGVGQVSDRQITITDSEDTVLADWYPEDASLDLIHASIAIRW